MIFTILFLALAAAIIALLIYWVMTSFRVEEDPRIGEVQEALPGANCGNCGYPGCASFAKACVEHETLDGLFCTVGGNAVMQDVADILGRTVEEQDHSSLSSAATAPAKHAPESISLTVSRAVL